MRRQRLRDPERMKGPGQMVIVEQFFVANREQRTTQRREHGELIVRPFDGRQRRADGFDLLAVVERLAADEQLADAACLERLDVLPRDVFAVADKPAEQETDMARLERYPQLRITTLRHRPSTSCDQPLDIRANRRWKRLLDLHSGYGVAA